MESVFSNPALYRAIVVGVFGGAGLALTSIYSRRGPLIYPVYAALLADFTRWREGHQSVETTSCN